MKSFYTTVIRSLAAASITLSLNAVAEVQMLDRIIAVVDDTTISQSELDARVNDVIRRTQAAGISLPSSSVLRDQVLDQLVDETLQLNIAKRYDINISDEEVIDSIRDMISRQGINEAQLMQSLQAEGLSLDQFKDNMRRQLEIQTISQGLVRQRIKINDKDIDSFLKSADAQFWIAPSYHLQHILIPIASGGGTAAVAKAQQQADDAFQRLQNGANFAEIAIAESKGPAALKGGDLGMRKSSELPTLFAEVAPTLAIGEVAKPIRSQAGFHIIRLLDTQGETKEIVSQNKVRHILIKTNEILDDQGAKEKLEGLRADILGGDSFAIVAKQYSDDLGSKASGGDMGWTSPGTFVPEFEKVVNTTAIGDISAPFKSQFGWHILQVTDRRDEDLSKEAIRNKARNILISRRVEDELQVWMQEIRDDAFIELKI